MKKTNSETTTTPKGKRITSGTTYDLVATTGSARRFPVRVLYADGWLVLLKRKER